MENEGFIKNFLDVLDMRSHLIMFFASFVFVIIAMELGRYFFESFFTFIFAVGFAGLQLSRHNYTWKYAGIILLFSHIIWFIMWVAGLWFYSEYFPVN